MLNLDFAILNAIQGMRSNILDIIMIIITYIGSTASFWIASAVVLIYRKKTRRDGIVIALSMILVLLLGTLLIKNIVMRPRPYNIPEGLLSAADLIIPKPMGIYSFPSSHSATAFAAATGIFFLNKKWGLGAYILAALIGFSRLYLYVHFPTDVLFGAVFGIVCAWLARWIMGKISIPT